MSEQHPDDLPQIDPEQFMGEPPAGDAHPTEFISNDQSADPTDTTETTDDTDSEDQS